MPPADPTAPYSPDAISTAALGADPQGDQFDEELRRLLRSRLILIHLLAIAYLVMLGVLFQLIPRTGADRAAGSRESDTRNLALPLAQSLVGAVVLWRRPAMSLRSLRLWELFHFATHAVYHGIRRFEILAFVAGGRPDPTAQDVGPAGAFSLFGFITIILAYGVLIPNTRRRSLVVVAALTAVPFVSVLAAVAVNPGLRAGHFAPLMIQPAALLIFPAAIAVFAAARADALQRRAFEAERRAEQLGQYALKRKLGAGGMGEVWLAEHGLLKRPCTVKFIRPDLSPTR